MAPSLFLGMALQQGSGIILGAISYTGSAGPRSPSLSTGALGRMENQGTAVSVEKAAFGTGSKFLQNRKANKYHYLLPRRCSGKKKSGRASRCAEAGGVISYVTCIQSLDAWSIWIHSGASSAPITSFSSPLRLSGVLPPPGATLSYRGRGMRAPCAGDALEGMALGMCWLWK